MGSETVINFGHSEGPHLLFPPHSHPHTFWTPPFLLLLVLLLSTHHFFVSGLHKTEPMPYSASLTALLSFLSSYISSIPLFSISSIPLFSTLSSPPSTNHSCLFFRIHFLFYLAFSSISSFYLFIRSLSYPFPTPFFFSIPVPPPSSTSNSNFASSFSLSLLYSSRLRPPSLHANRSSCLRLHTSTYSFPRSFAFLLT